MSNLYGDALQEIVTALQNAGIKATTEMARVQLPGALVVPGIMTFDHLDPETYSANINVYLLTSNKGSIPAMDDLQELLTKFRTTFDVLEAEPISLELLNVAGPDPVPGLQITIEATISKD